MSDIFREVDEDLRREQVKKLWDRFAPYIIGLAVLIVAGTAGYRGWEFWQQRQAQATGDRFLAALDSSTAGAHDEAIAALQGIAADGSGGYPVLARFRMATEKAEAGDVAGAVTEFDTIAAGTASDEIKALARLRAALLLVDSASADDIQARIGDLAATGNIWRHTAREILGLAAFRAGDYSAARKQFEDISVDQETPQDLRQRAQLMLTLIAARIGPEAAAPAAPATDAGSAAPQD
jgi:hypothetical protein